MKKITFIINPISGGKDKQPLIRTIEASIDRTSFEYRTILTEYPGHATEIARTCEADIVVAVGGDGTVSEVAQGAAESGKAFGIIPCGSGDGLALHLGISRNPGKAVKTLNKGHIETVDYGRVDGRPFFCTTGVGLDAAVAWEFAASGKRGLANYISQAWRLWQDFRPETYEIDIDGERIVTPAVFVTVGNANQWGNQARITSLASVRDGELDLAIVEPFRTVEIPLLATKLLDGRAHTSRRVRMFRGKHITIHRSAPGPAHSDGDPCEAGTDITVDIVPAALRVVVPAGRAI